SRLSEEETLRRFLRELRTCRRVRHVHPEDLLGLHIAVADGEPRTIAAIAEQLRDFRSVTPSDLLDLVQPAVWALELARARTDWIYACEESKLHDFLHAAGQAENDRLLNAAYDAAEGLAVQSNEVLERFAEGAAQDVVMGRAHS